MTEQQVPHPDEENLDKAVCDDWTKIPIHCAECGAQFLRKVRYQKYCDEHRHLGGAVIRPQEQLPSTEVSDRKKRSIVDRAFTAAQHWISRKGFLGYTENREDHIAYRCGWVAGYKAARKDIKS